MAVKRQRTQHGLITREQVQLRFDGEVSMQDWEDLAAAFDDAGQPPRLTEITEWAQGVLTAAGLVDSSAIMDLRHAEDERLYTKEWFAVELLRYVTAIRLYLQQGDSAAAVDWAIHLGEQRVISLIKLGLESDVLFGREVKESRRRGGKAVARKRAEKTDRSVQSLLNKLSSSDYLTAASVAHTAARASGEKSETVRKRLTRARARKRKLG
jgi:hypothetical protein